MLLKEGLDHRVLKVEYLRCGLYALDPHHYVNGPAVPICEPSVSKFV